MALEKSRFSTTSGRRRDNRSIGTERKVTEIRKHEGKYLLKEGTQ